MNPIPDLDEVIAETKPKLAVVPPPVQTPAHFDRLRPLLEDALKGGFYTMDDVIVALVENRVQFWPGKNCAVITEIQTYPSDKVVQVWVAGGDLEEIVSMAPGLEAWARINGCTAVLIEGRQGWGRVMKDHGYEPFSYTARKAL